MIEINKIEVFYTGGGVWLAGLYTDENKYFIVDSDFDGCLTAYDRRSDIEDGTDWPCSPEGMLWSRSAAELTATEKKIYKKMLSALKREAW